MRSIRRRGNHFPASGCPSRRCSRAIFSAATTCSILIAAQSSLAASSTWSGGGGTADSNWSTAGNWTGNVIPGVADGVTFNNTDTATFRGNPAPDAGNSGNNNVTVDLNRNIGSIVFDYDGVTQGSYGIGPTAGTSNTLYLTGGGSILETAAVATIVGSDFFNSPLVVKGSTYTFDNESTSGPSGLKFNSAITGGTPGPLTLTFTGVNFSGSGTSNCQVKGGIGNGAASVVNVVKDGTGTWSFQSTDTYTGTTTINNGTFRANFAAAIPATSDVTVNNGGNLRLSVAQTVPSVTVNAGGSLSANAAGFLNVAANSGPGVFLQFESATPPTGLTLNVTVNLTGTGAAGTGGISVSGNGTDTGTVTLGSSTATLDLGTINRTIAVDHAGTNSTDFQISSIVADSGGIIKTGLGTLKLNNASNTFTGPIEIQQGSLKLIGTSSANTLSGSNALIIDGGDLNLNPDGVGATDGNTTVASTNFTGGSISANSPPPGTGINFPNAPASLLAPSFNFNVPAAGLFTVNAVLADGAGGPSPLVSSGAGNIILNKASTYTGTTSINAGTFTISNTGSIGSTSLTVAAGATANVNGSVPSTAVINANGVVTFGANQNTGILARTIDTLNIASTGQVSVGSPSAQANRTVLLTNTLGFAGAFGSWQGKLQLSSNDLIVHGGSLTNITDQLKQGFNQAAVNGYWNGSAGIVSSAAAGDATHLTTLGVIQNNDGNGHAIYGTGTTLGLFDGQNPAITDILVKYTYYGDADLSGTVDGTDYAKIDNGFTHPALKGWFNGDFNYDGVVDGSDYSLIDNAFNMQGPSLGGGSSASFSAAVASEVAAVPEPGSFGLAITAAIGLLTRRRRRRN